MSFERFRGIWAQTYREPIIHTCKKCGKQYPHDDAYKHALYECLQRDSQKYTASSIK
jgi:hypothetical protein